MEYDIQRCTRRCAATGRELAPGETFYSVLVEQGGALRRLDYSMEAWTGPPETAVGWWRARLPSSHPQGPQPPPTEKLLQLFEELQGDPSQADFRYLLALLLVRRRSFRLEEQQRDGEGHQTLVLYCPRREATYHVPVVPPHPSRADALQKELDRLLTSLPQPAGSCACQGTSS